MGAHCPTEQTLAKRQLLRLLLIITESVLIHVLLFMTKISQTRLPQGASTGLHTPVPGTQFDWEGVGRVPGLMVRKDQPHIAATLSTGPLGGRWLARPSAAQAGVNSRERRGPCPWGSPFLRSPPPYTRHLGQEGWGEGKRAWRVPEARGFFFS